MFFQFNVTKKDQEHCICLYKSSRSGARHPPLLSALNLWIFSRISFPSLFLEEVVNEIMQQWVNCDM